MYSFEIYFKGVDEPVYANGTQEQYEQIIEYLGAKCVLTFEDDWGCEVSIHLKDAYAVYKKEIKEAIEPLEDELEIRYIFDSDQD